MIMYLVINNFLIVNQHINSTGMNLFNLKNEYISYFEYKIIDKSLNDSLAKLRKSDINFLNVKNFCLQLSYSFSFNVVLLYLFIKFLSYK